jgi:hypothetical protein
MANVNLSTIIGDPLGTIREFAVAPNQNWLRCDGTVVAKNAYPSLANTLPLLPLPEIFKEGATIGNISARKSLGVYGGITFFSDTNSINFYEYQRDIASTPVAMANNIDGVAWCPPVFRENTMFVSATAGSGNVRIGFANVDLSFSNASINTFITSISSTQPGASGAWFNYSSNNEVVFRTDGGLNYAFQGANLTANSTNWVQVFPSPSTLNRRSSLVITSNASLAVANTTTWSFKDGRYAWWRQASNSSIRTVKATWVDTNHFLIVANNATIYRATESQVLSGSLGTAVSFAPSTNVVSIHAFGNTVVVAGLGGVLGNSVDGGQTFTVRTSGTTSNFSSVYLANSTHGVAVGNGGLIRRTTDSGNTWSTVTSPVGANNFSQVVFANGKFYLTFSPSGVIPHLWDSADAGSTWNLVPPPQGVWASTTTSMFLENKKSSNTLAVFLDSPVSDCFELSGNTWSAPYDMGFNQTNVDIAANEGPEQLFVYSHSTLFCTDRSFFNWDWQLTIPNISQREFIKSVEVNAFGLFQLHYTHSAMNSTTVRYSFSPNKNQWNRRAVGFRNYVVTPRGVMVGVIQAGSNNSTTESYTVVATSYDGGITFGNATTEIGNVIQGICNDGEVIFKFKSAANSTALAVEYSTDYGASWVGVGQTTGALANSLSTFTKYGDQVSVLFNESTSVQPTIIKTYNYDTSASFRLPISTNRSTDGSYLFIKAR